MWEALVWWRRIDSPDVARTVGDLRQDTLRLVLVSTSVGYVFWHFVQSEISSTLQAAHSDSLNHWLLAPVALIGLAGAWALQRHRRPLLAAWCFLLTGVTLATVAVWLLGSPSALLLYPLLGLAAVVLLHPLAGVIVGGLGLAVLAGLRAAGPLAWLPADRLLETALACLLTLAVAWVLARNLVVTAEWSARSYAEAWRHVQEARANRAELMQALKQLDHAYYALQRANAALELAWTAADAAERSKTEFVTNISHELRTPLNLIIGFSELILTSPETYRVPLPAAYRGDLNAVYRSAQHLLTLTNDVIDLARVGMDRLAIVREPVDLAQVIADACGIVRPFVEAKGLWLRIAVTPGLPVLQLDPLRIRQVLLNLLTNAARFTERGGITVAVRHEPDAVEVRVSDTGAGIAPEDLSRVFDEFFSGEPRGVAGQSFGGVGLGLPLSRRLVELHGGRIGVDSHPQAGACFWFRLPTTTEPARVGAARGPARRAGHGQPVERILVLAGAEPAVAETLQRHLPAYRLVAVADGERAVAAAVEERAVAILAGTDVAVDAAATVPVLRLPLPRGRLVADGLEALACLGKPVTRARLRATIAGLARPPSSILLVDDDQHFLRLLSRMLQATIRGVTCRTSPDGREALALMASWRPDLVILDLVMPELSGAETLAAMRARPDLAAVPVIVVSAQDLLQARTSLPGPIVVTKPDGFALEEVLGAVEGLLGVFRPPRAYLATAERGPAHLS